MLKVIHPAEYYKYHIINSDDVEKYGMEKACILGNIHHCIELELPNDRYHEKFSYIKKEKFYKLVDEMIKAGLLIKE